MSLLNYRKAQSSIEYLSTYAWAFVVLLVTISALSFFGVFNSDTYTITKCESGNQIACIDAYLAINTSDDNTSTYIMFRNNYPRKIVIENVSLIDNDFTTVSSQQRGLIVPSAKKATITFSTEEFTPRIGKKEFLQFIITYRRYDGAAMTQNYTITGQLTTETQKKDDSPEPYCGDGNLDDEEECDPPMKTSSTSVSSECTSAFPSDSDKHYCQSDCLCGPSP